MRNHFGIKKLSRALMQKTRITSLNFYAGIIGNVLEHYDTAVFSLLIPFITPLFFPSFDPLTGMILAYGMLPLGNFAKPIGSFVFGYMGDRIGRKKALYGSLVGLSLTTGCIGCLPIFEHIGYWAPALMAIGRILQNFFIGGEAAGGAVFILEHTPEPKHSIVSSLYGSSTIIGITAASSLIAVLSWLGGIADLWRIPFLVGFLTSLGGVFIRYQADESLVFSEKEEAKTLLKSKIIEYWKPLLAVMVVSGFSACNYILVFILPNGFLPKIAPVTQTEVMTLNSLLLVLDMALLPIFGWLSDQIGARRSMLWAAIATGVLSIPLFGAFEGADWMTIVVVRTLLVTLGVWFCAPLHAWIQTLVPSNSRYLLLSIGYSIGSQLLGSPAASLSLWLYRETGWASAPGVYSTAVSLLAVVTLYLLPQEILHPVKASKAARVSPSL